MKLEDLYTEAELAEGWLCKAFSRHFFTQGAMYEERDYYGRPRWVNRLTCEHCGTKRVTPLTPGTREYIRSPRNPHDYFHSTTYRSSISTSEALRLLLKRLSEGQRYDSNGDLVTENKIRSIQGSRGRKAR